MVLQLWGLYRVSGPPQPPWFPFADKLEHAAGFALPVLLILLACGVARLPRLAVAQSADERARGRASSPRTPW